MQMCNSANFSHLIFQSLAVLLSTHIPQSRHQTAHGSSQSIVKVLSFQVILCSMLKFYSLHDSDDLNFHKFTVPLVLTNYFSAVSFQAYFMNVFLRTWHFCYWRSRLENNCSSFFGYDDRIYTLNANSQIVNEHSFNSRSLRKATYAYTS